MTDPLAVTTSAPKRRSRWGCLLSTLSGFALVVLIIGVGYFAWYSNARGHLDAAIARVEARGEPLWFRDLAPKAVDPDTDGSALYLRALTKMQAPSAAFSSAVFADPTKPPSEDPVVIAELAKNREALDLLAEVMKKPNFRIPIDYDTNQPFRIVLDEVQSARDLSRLLAGGVSIAVAAGQRDQAVESIERMFDLSELLRNEPFTITQLVRLAISAVALNSLKQALPTLDLTPEQFVALDERLARMHRDFTLAPAMLGERASTFTTLTHLYENVDFLVSDPADGLASSMRWYARGPLQPMRLEDQAFMLQIMSEVIDSIDKTGREGIDAMHDLEARVQNAPQSHVFTRLLIPALVNVHMAGLRHREKLMTARLGIRVDRYFAEHGRLPTTLEEICDDRLPSLPNDVFTGKPHVYRTTATGFIIYSVGPNGIDDGGGQTPDMLEYHSGFEVSYPQKSESP
jgi:hypothetical protein